MADEIVIPLPRRAGSKRRLRLPTAAVLVGGFGAMMLIAVAAVLALGLLSASRNTYDLLRDKAQLALDEVTIRIRQQLDPVHDQGLYLKQLIEDGTLNPADSTRMTDVLKGALAATPQVTGIAFLDPALAGPRLGRVNGHLRITSGSAARSENLRSVVDQAASHVDPFWAAPVWVGDLHTSVLTLVVPVRRGATNIGTFLIAVSLGDLSRFLTDLYAQTGLNAFVLYDHTHVLAHQALASMQQDFSTATPPLPRIDQLPDPVLARLWNKHTVTQQLGPDTTGRLVSLNGTSHLVLMRDLAGYGELPWMVGLNMPVSDLGDELNRLRNTGFAGLAILLVSVAAALFVGRRLSGRISQVARAAERVRRLDFHNVEPLPDSRLRELADAAAAFNAMVAGLAWFETYVPKALVLRLIHHGDGRELASEERQLTVMFTDIAGFSALAESMSAAETASLLNEHFSLIAACIEAEGGTVDKFIGDATMTFWGAPDSQPDHAARALRAARAMAPALREDNARRRAAGLPVVCIRTGIHTGPAVVGNIGSPSRINYTIVGDTVNIASRIEELGKLFAGEDVVVLASEAAVTAAGEAASGFTPVGRHGLRGLSADAEIYRLDLQAETDPPPAGTA